MPAQRKRNAQSANRASADAGSLELKPPAILSHIAWFLAHWREHKLVIVLAVLIVGTPAVVSGLIWLSKGNFENVPSKTGQQNPKERDETNAGDALRVQFRDGTIANVALSFTAAVDRDKVPELVTTYGQQERALSELKTSVVAAAYKVLEAVTIDEARQNRSRIEAAILNTTAEAQKRTFYVIYAVNLLEIEPIK